MSSQFRSGSSSIDHQNNKSYENHSHVCDSTTITSRLEWNLAIEVDRRLASGSH